METGRVLKILAEAFGTVALTAFAIFMQEEFAKNMFNEMKK